MILYSAYRTPEVPGLSFSGKGGRTQQQFRDECDINTIVKRFNITGEIPVERRSPLPDAHYDYMDLMQAHEFLKAAESSFLDLPAEQRSRFNNDPLQFLAFVDDPKNADELVRLGMRVKPADPVVSPPA